MTDYEIRPVLLRLELKDEMMSDDEKVMLKRYGGSSTGDSIIRDVMLPGNMPLHNLHYAIQKLFGFQNSHLRSFHLPETIEEEFCGENVLFADWKKWVGVIFQPFSEGEEDIFWDDDYQDGSFVRWLRKKYTGPYVYGGYYEDYDAAQDDISAFIEAVPEIKLRESFDDYLKRSRQGEKGKPKTLGKKPILSSTLAELNNAIAIEQGFNNLLERLTIDDFFYEKSDLVKQIPQLKNLDYIRYVYDFGDYWEIKVSQITDHDTLIAEHLVTAVELSRAAEEVYEKLRPICLSAQGLNVVDDAGGLSGFARCLKEVYEPESKEEQRSTKGWLKTMGWSDKTLIPSKIL